MAGGSWLGRREITLDELDTMTPAERHAEFESRVVKDLSELPASYRAEIQSWVASVIERHEGEQRASARRES